MITAPDDPIAQPRRYPLRRRVRPPWLIVGLSVATFDLYTFFWLYATWRELKHERQDDKMHPVWHALATLVPIYGYFRFHAHMRTIKELADERAVLSSLRPGVAVAVWIVTQTVNNLTFRLTLQGLETPLWLDLITSLVLAWLLWWGQSTLNALWRAAPEGPTETRVHWLEWVVLVIGGLLWVLAAVGSVLP
jgi:hypothetical protein